jgi:tRNA G10  N-methylase Trm11
MAMINTNNVFFFKKIFSLSIIYIYIVPNAWVEHIKKYAKENNLSYGCALSMPDCKNSCYKKTKESKTKESKTEESKTKERKNTYYV